MFTIPYERIQSMPIKVHTYLSATTVKFHAIRRKPHWRHTAALTDEHGGQCPLRLIIEPHYNRMKSLKLENWILLTYNNYMYQAYCINYSIVHDILHLAVNCNGTAMNTWTCIRASSIHSRVCRVNVNARYNTRLANFRWNNKMQSCIVMSC